MVVMVAFINQVGQTVPKHSQLIDSSNACVTLQVDPGSSFLIDSNYFLSFLAFFYTMNKCFLKALLKGYINLVLIVSNFKIDDQ